MLATLLYPVLEICCICHMLDIVPISGIWLIPNKWNKWISKYLHCICEYTLFNVFLQIGLSTGCLSLPLPNLSLNLCTPPPPIPHFTDDSSWFVCAKPLPSFAAHVSEWERGREYLSVAVCINTKKWNKKKELIKWSSNRIQGHVIISLFFFQYFFFTREWKNVAELFYEFIFFLSDFFFIGFIVFPQHSHHALAYPRNIRDGVSRKESQSELWKKRVHNKFAIKTANRHRWVVELSGWLANWRTGCFAFLSSLMIIICRQQ